jgi:hypothetical protein
MHRHSLREIAKIGVGLVAADLISVLWFSGAGFFPVTILNITWTSAAVVPIVLFDSALILLLAHYGWSMKLPIESPSEKKLLLIIGTVFFIVALVHLVRLAFALDLNLGDVAVPLWMSWLGVIIPAYLSYCSFHFAGHRPRK